MNFKINQKVVCIKAHSQGTVKKDEIYTVTGVYATYCLCKDKVLITVGIKSTHKVTKCAYCGMTHDTIREHLLNAELFRPLVDDEIESLISEIEEEINHKELATV